MTTMFDSVFIRARHNRFFMALLFFLIPLCFALSPISIASSFEISPALVLAIVFLCYSAIKNIGEFILLRLLALIVFSAAIFFISMLIITFADLSLSPIHIGLVSGIVAATISNKPQDALAFGLVVPWLCEISGCAWEYLSSRTVYLDLASQNTCLVSGVSALCAFSLAFAMQLVIRKDKKRAQNINA